MVDFSIWGMKRKLHMLLIRVLLFLNIAIMQLATVTGVSGILEVQMTLGEFLVQSVNCLLDKVTNS